MSKNLNWPQDYINQVIQGDCLEIMKQMPDKCVDLVLTDPPYGIDYKGRNRPNEIQYIKIENDNGEIDYTNLIIELQRIANKVIIFGAQNFLKSLPCLGRWLCWDKRLTEKADKMLGNAFELAWIDSDAGFYKMYRCLHGGVVNADSKFGTKKRWHPTQKPIELMEKIIQDFSKETDLIFDPFLGSGTTAIAAKQLGHKFIGIEISSRYCQIARDRLRQEVLF